MIGLNIKGQNLHGMRDPRWTIFQKVHMYKELISLQKRDREVIKYHTDKLNRQEEKLLGELRKIAKQKQDDLRNALLGNQNKMWSTLGIHRRIQLAQGRNTPERVIENLYQMIDHKRKMKDKQIYTKRVLMEKYKIGVLKKGEQDDLYLMQKRGIKTHLERREQSACQKKQNAVMKTIAATTIRQSYRHILRILHKDATYFNPVLGCLELDCTLQSRMLISVIEMGQTVTEYLIDISEEYEDLEAAIKMNMMERERSLRDLHGTIEHMSRTFNKLVRSESDVLIIKDDDQSETNDHFLEELMKIENILNEVRQIALVPRFDRIYPKLFNQRKQKDRLQSFSEQLLILKESLVKGGFNLEVILNLRAHTYNEDKIRYLEAKRDILRAIRQKQKYMTELSSAMVLKQNISQSLRLAFKHIWNELKSVHMDDDIVEPTEIVVDEHGDFLTQYVLDEIKLSADPQRVPLNLVPEGEDSLSLMATVNKKLRILCDAFRPNSTLMRQAQLFFNRAIMETKPDIEEEQEIDLLAGLIIEDSRLPSYASVKAASRQFVLDNTVDELALVAAQVAARKKPGAYFRKLMKAEEKRRKTNRGCGVY